MYQFLIDNRDELIARCKQKVEKRPGRSATADQLEHGIPLFIDQLTRTLQAEEQGLSAASVRISGTSGGYSRIHSEISVGAAAHGKELLALGFTVDQAVHDYGDLCQAITDLALERDEAFSAHEFRTLNRCLDNAIADAVTEFSRLREINLVAAQRAATNERVGFLVHELRNGLGTAALAVSALEASNMPISGATGAVLKRSLLALNSLVSRSLDDVRHSTPVEQHVFQLAAFIEDAKQTAQLDPIAIRCTLSVENADAALGIRGNREMLLAALGNLLQNAFKFTHDQTMVTLKTSASKHHVTIEVLDHCGGLPNGDAHEIFTPFHQRSGDRSGLGLGLSIARQSIEADSGTLSVRDMPGVGCVLSIRMPRHAFEQHPAIN
ncbi:HAMP domain-containing sensor histidine kinase [Ramlibacter sp.]|uniref:sensor histidine kinase n=1 Tax=Ramlibacter sp. TaxID=1917967 RepID=UPI0017A0AC85|nr:HAMP domain-containing sensor histidine kinase [Ramlibacter sp.]MBA2673808.1 HAMP domain-containing histidine kinase [Ramlibacter sp.]